MVPIIPTLCTALLSLNLSGMTTEKLELCLQHEDQIIEKSQKYDIDPAIIMSMIYNESKWEPHVISRHGACGLMQAIPRWVPKQFSPEPVTCELLKNPEMSIDIGIMTLGRYVHEHKYNMVNALCLYNTGQPCQENGNVRGKKYTRNILHIANKIKKSVKNR